MQKVLKVLGDSAAILGIAICLVTGVLRLSGLPVIFGFEAITLFIGGIALMVFACLARLQVLQD
jgi:hypothetical protein